MNYFSTNENSPAVDFITALFRGQAPDLGLYMPETIPSLSADEIRSMKSKSYPEIAEIVLSRYLSDCLAPGRLSALCRDAYDFEVPVESAGERRYILRLDRGPTASFKDFAAAMMSRLMSEFRGSGAKRLVVLTATSGDTGGAVARAFHGIPGIDVIVLFPPGEVSGRQRRQMTTLSGNVTAIAVDGKFDNCQALVKRAFADPELRSVDLTSANSINIGRLLPQSVYYAFVYSRLADYPEPMVVSVPSGNFGNMMGALLAARMGVPISRVIIATNSNDEVPQYLSTGVYRKIDPSRVCLSNAMNVGHPSNLARVVSLYGGRMDETGAVSRPPDMDGMRRELFAVRVSDAETRDAIRDAWREHRLLLEPHGAVGWVGLRRYLELRTNGNRPLCVSVETAHPAKFPEEIERLLGFTPEIPPSLGDLEGDLESFQDMPADYDAFRAFLSNRYST
jgi:threonine synthase